MSVTRSRDRQALGVSEDALTGDEAFEWFFRAQFPLVRRSVYLILADAGRADEVAQDAFVQLYRHWRRVSAYEHPEAWVRRVAIRLAFRRTRRDRARTTLERRTWVRADVEGPDPASGIDVVRAIAALSPMQRAAIVLHYYEDRPMAEIAHILGCSPSTAKVHVFKGRKRLAVLLDDPQGVGDVG